MSTTLKSFNDYVKEEARLLKNFDQCRTRKCKKYMQKRNSVAKSFNKEQTAKCQQKSAKAFYECSSKLYNGSTLEKLSKNVVQCSLKKCKSKKKKLNAIRKKM